MEDKMKKKKATRWDFSELLDSEEKIDTYIRVTLEEAGDDPALIARCLGNVAKARGMTDLAKKTGMSRPALYKALSGEGNPEFSTIVKVAHAFGYRVNMTPINPSAHPRE
jgi:probable addiction module antidote protein